MVMANNNIRGAQKALNLGANAATINYRDIEVTIKDAKVKVIALTGVLQCLDGWHGQFFGTKLFRR